MTCRLAGLTGSSSVTYLSRAGFNLNPLRPTTVGLVRAHFDSGAQADRAVPGGPDPDGQGSRTASTGRRVAPAGGREPVGDWICRTPWPGAFRPGPGGCPAGPVTRSPRSVAGSAAAARMRAAATCKGGAERAPSCDRQRCWRCLRDRRTTGFPQIRAVSCPFWLDGMRVGVTGG
jgi:hypothetical protein